MNSVLWIIEQGVNRELFISDAPEEDEDVEANAADVNAIVDLWKKLRSQKNINRIGDRLWKDVIMNNTRARYKKAQASLDQMSKSIPLPKLW